MPENATKQKEDNRAKDQAAAQFETLAAMVERLEHARECDGDECSLMPRQIAEGLNMFFDGKPVTESEREEYHDEDKASEAIQEDPLSVEVRSGWSSSSEDMQAEDYRILLCTGGPAVQIVGELDQHGQPSTATLQYQDWFTAWEDYREADESILLSYAQNFYFGE